MKEVLVVVEGGIADVRKVPKGVRVRIIDHDPEDTGDPKIEYTVEQDEAGCLVQSNVETEEV